jgi:hypothetical protein
MVPRGIDASAHVAIADNPVAIAECALDEKFNTGLAEREIKLALAAKDADLTRSFVDLAAARRVAIAPALTEKVRLAVDAEDSAIHAAASFGQGFVIGDPDDVASLAGTTLGDLFVFGDIRDAVRESARLALGEKADTMVLGLACIGLAINAGSYATLGA